jgi:hypothetical protein
MNVLAFVFTLLLILGLSLSGSMKRLLATKKSETIYLAEAKERRKLQGEYTKKLFDKLAGTSNDPEYQKTGEESIVQNRSESRINLFALQHEAPLRQVAVELLATFYEDLLSPETADQFLSVLLESLPSEPIIDLETVWLVNQDWQPLYYELLKGTPSGRPSLLDYFKADPSSSTLGLHTASESLLTLLFGEKAGSALYSSIHARKMPVQYTRTSLKEFLLLNSGMIREEKFYDLFDFQTQGVLADTLVEKVRVNVLPSPGTDSTAIRP